MNRIYKVIWSKVKNQYVVVSELAHSNGKQSSTSKISSVRGSLRAMLAALMVAGGIFSFTPAVYAAQANEASVSVLSDGIFWLQNGDNSIVIDEGNFDTYFVGAVRQADGTYTINGQVVSDKNLYNINDEIGAFVVDNNVYTGEVLDKDSHTVLSMQQRTIVNEDGFYAGNGKGTYNTLSKDGLWVGGTKDGEGFHVDNDGNVRTTGNMMVDGAFSAADGNATIAEDGSTYIKTEKSQLMVNDNVAGMTSGNGSVSVSNNSATLSGAGSVVDAGLNGIILTERTGNNSVTVNQDGTTVNGNLNVENGDFSAANGNATIEEDGTTLIQAGSSQLIVNDDVAGMTSGNGSIAVSNNSAEIRGAGNLITADLNGIALTERTGNNSVTVNQDGTTVSGSFQAAGRNFIVNQQGEMTAPKATIDNVVIDNNEVTGLSNTTWTGNKDDVVTGRAATEDQLKTVSDNAAAAHTAVTVNGGTVASENPNYTNGNLQLSQSVDKITGKTTYDVKLNNDITLTSSDQLKSVNIDGTEGSITLSADASKAPIEINAAQGTITGLQSAISDDEDWSTFMNGGVEGDRAATESDLREVAQHSVLYNADDNGVNYNQINLAGEKYNEATGEGGTKITNVAKGTEDADAVNFGQLKQYATYTGGDGININNNVVSVDYGNGLDIKDGQLVAKAGENVTIDENGISAKDTTLDVTASTSTATTNGYGNDYKVVDTDGNTVNISDVASATKLAEVAGNSANIDLTNITESGKTVIKDVAKGADQHIEAKSYTVNENGTVTFDYVDGDGNKIENQTATITGLATKDAVDKATEDAKKHTTVKLAEGENNLSLNPGTNTDEGIEYTLGLSKELSVDSVNAGGTVINSTGLSIGDKQYVTANGINANSQKITNVATGKASTDAVNVSQLEKYVGDNATYTDGDGININNKVVSVDYGNGLDIKDGKLVAKAGNNVTIDENGISAKDTTLDVASSTSTDTANGYGKDYKVVDTDGNTVNISDVASATKLAEVAGNSADINLSNITESGKTVIKDVAKGADQHIGAKQYTVNENGTVTLDYVDGNGNKIENQTATITGLATKDAVDDATKEAKKHTTVKLAEGENNLSLNPETNTNEGIEYTLGLSKDLGVNSVTAGNVKVNGTTNRVTGLSNTTWDKDIAKAVEDNANGEAGYAATQGQLKTVYDEAIKNATRTTYTAGDGLNLGTDNKFSVKAGQGVTVDSSGVAVKAGNGIAVNDKGVNVNLTADEKNLVLEGDGQKTLGLADSLTGLASVTATTINGTTGNFATSITVGASDTGIVIGDGKITGLSTDKINSGDGTYAVNKDYVDTKFNEIQVDGKEYKAGAGLALGGTNKDTFSVQTGNGIKVDEKTNAVTVNNGNGLEYDEQGTEGQKKLQVNANENKGIEVTADGVGVKLAANSNLTVDTNGLRLATDLTGLNSIATGSLTATGDVSAANFKVGGKTYISSTGINANEQAITGLPTEDNIFENSTNAVSGAEIYDIQQKVDNVKTYEAGDGISISGDNNAISVNKGDGLTFVGTDGNKQLQVLANTAKGITVDGSGVAVNAGDGLTFDDGSVAVKLAQNSNLVLDSTNGLSLSPTLTNLTSIESGTGTFDTMTIGATETPGSGITITGTGITGLQNPDRKDTSAAVNVGYLNQFVDTQRGLAVQYDNASKEKVTLGDILNDKTTKITNLTNADLNSTSKDAVTGQQLFATNEKVGNAKWSGTKFIDSADNLTDAAKKLDAGIGNLDFSTNNAKLGSTKYDSATQAISVLDRAIGNLTMTGKQAYYESGTRLTSVTQGINDLSTAIGDMDFGGTNFIHSMGSLTSAVQTLDTNLKATLSAVGVRETTDDEGNTSASPTIEWGDNFHYVKGGTVVDGIRTLDGEIYDLDGRVGILENEVLGTSSNALSTISESGISTLSALSSMDMNTAKTLASINPNALKAVANLSAENAVVSDGEVMGSSAANSEPTRNPEPGDNYDGDFNVGGTLKVTDDATFDKNVNVGGKLDVKGEANFHEKATFDKDVSIGGTLEMNGNRITGLAAGKEDTDAVNVSQLNEVRQDVADNRTAINTMGNQVNRLSNRIDKVGAGAAALAALHPLDFDPDDKLSFAAGYGNYAGENAVAVGAFYQPNEDTMFSVGGTFGNDENMVNAGVSFKLGQKSNVSRSRVSMAKELVSLRDEVAQLKALMAHAGILPSNGQFDTSALFPDVPENHWAYEYVHELGRLGILEGYADGNFEGDRMMTRYEMAAIVYRAMQKGVNIDSRMLKEFEPELKLIRVDVVARDDDGNPTIERVRVNEDTQQA